MSAHVPLAFFPCVSSSTSSGLPSNSSRSCCKVLKGANQPKHGEWPGDFWPNSKYLTNVTLISLKLVDFPHKTTTFPAFPAWSRWVCRIGGHVQRVSQESGHPSMNSKSFGRRYKALWDLSQFSNRWCRSSVIFTGKQADQKAIVKEKGLQCFVGRSRSTCFDSLVKYVAIHLAFLAKCASGRSSPPFHRFEDAL